MNASILLSILWTVTWQSALLIGVILLLRGTLRRRLSARWRYSLWSILALRLALPILPSNPFGLLPSDGPVDGGVSVFPAQAGLPAEVVNLTAIAAAPVESAAAFPWASVLLSIWLIGAVVFLARHVLRVRRLRQWLSVASPEAAWHGEVARACADLGLKSPPAVYRVAGGSSPVVFGCFRPVLVLPEDTMNALGDDERLAVLRHEAAHLAAKDTWTDTLRSLLLCLHWFNPLLWWVNRFVVADREEACDERVLATTDSQPAGYGEALLAVLRVRSQTTMPTGALGVLDHSLKQRITGIRCFRPSGVLRRVSAVLLVASLAFFGLTKAQGPQVKPVLDEGRTKAILKDANVDMLNFKGAHLNDVIAFMNFQIEKSGVVIKATPMRNMPRVGINLRRVSAFAALEMLANITGTTITYPLPGTVMLVPGADGAKPAAAVSAPAKPVADHPEGDDDLARLKRHLEQLTAEQRANLRDGLGGQHPKVLAQREKIQEVMRKIRQAEMIQVTLQLKQVSMGTALKAVCALTGQSFHVQENGLVLVRHGGKNSGANTPRAKETLQHLQTIIIPELRFRDANVLDVYEFLRGHASQAGKVVNIVVEPKK